MPRRLDDYDHEIVDIIPERFDSDPDSRQARRGARVRYAITAVLGLTALAAAGLTLRHIVSDDGPKEQSAQVPLIKADVKPVKNKPGPDERGGMDVPNRDKLVYERLGSGDSEPQVERLLPPPEAPQPPPAQIPGKKPPPPVAAAAPLAVKPAMPAPAPKGPESLVPAFGAPSVGPASAPPPVAAAPPPAVAQAAMPVSGPLAPKSLLPPNPAPAPPPAAAPVKPAGTQPVVSTQPKPEAAPPPPAKLAGTQPVQSPQHVAPTVKPSAGGAWLVQLAAVRAPTEADREWARLKKSNADVLDGLSLDVAKVELPEKGTMYRLRAGPLDESGAKKLCQELAQRKTGCISVRK